MQMHQVKYFLEVCQTLNFTRAAEVCGVAQPSLTKAIKKLETEVGGELFHRERNKTHLTDLGLLIKPHLMAIHEAGIAVETDVERFKNLKKAKLRLGVMCTIGPTHIAPFLSNLCERVPNLELELQEGTGNELVEALMGGESDAAVMALPEWPERLQALPLYEERYVVAFGRGHRFEAMNQVPLSALEDEPYLYRMKCEFVEHHAHLGVGDMCAVNVKHQSEREDWIQALVLNGMGCSIMPEYLPTLPGIPTRPIVDPEVKRTISLVTVGGRRFSPTMEKVVRRAREFHWT